MARSMTAKKSATTLTGYQMLTGVYVRTASATAPSATTAMLVVQPTLTRRWLERDTDRNFIEHLRCDQMMEPRHCRLDPEGRGRQCFRSAWSEVVSAAFGRQLMTFWCDLEALVDTIPRARSDLVARCPRKRYPR